MRLVIWEDENGYKHRSSVRDDDPDLYAEMNMGIPCDPPNIELRLDWEEIKRNLNNVLVDRGIFTLHDVRVIPNSLRSAIETVMYRPLLALYLQDDTEIKQQTKANK